MTKLTKREQIAAMAMQAIIGKLLAETVDMNAPRDKERQAARGAVVYADELIAELEQKP